MNANQSAKVLALGDPTRLKIFECLARGPAAVGELASVFPVSRPAISQHLSVLKKAGLVRDRREGTRRVYELDPGGIQDMRAYFERFWATAFDAFKNKAEEVEHE